METLAQFLKRMRKTYGLTQIDLAEKSGVGLRFLREMEQGKKTTLRLDKVNKVLEMFGCEMGVVRSERKEEDDEASEYK